MVRGRGERSGTGQRIGGESTVGRTSRKEIHRVEEYLGTKTQGVERTGGLRLRGLKETRGWKRTRGSESIQGFEGAGGFGS